MRPITSDTHPIGHDNSHCPSISVAAVETSSRDFLARQLEVINEKLDVLTETVRSTGCAIMSARQARGSHVSSCESTLTFSPPSLTQPSTRGVSVRHSTRPISEQGRISKKRESALPPRLPRSLSAPLTRIENLSMRFGDRVGELADLSDFIQRHDRRASGRKKWRINTWMFLEDSLSSKAASLYSNIMSVIISMSVIASLIGFLPFVQQSTTLRPDGLLALFIQFSFEIFFAAELLLRFISCPDRWMFLRIMYNIIDLCSLVPIIPRSVMLTQKLRDPDADVSTLSVFFCIVPALRLMRFLRRFDKFHLLIKAFKAAADALPVLLFTSLLMTLIFSAIFYMVEERDNIPSYGSAVWLTIITMSTVGYGNVVAQTPEGRCCTTALIVVSQLYLAIPIAIVGVTFTDVWRDRHRSLLMQRLRDTVARAGFTPLELYRMFRRFLLLDSHGEGEMTVEEFVIFVDIALTNVPDDWITEVVETFDEDCSGGINFHVFWQALFPGTLPEVKERFLHDHMNKLKLVGDRGAAIAALRRSFSGNDDCSFASELSDRSGNRSDHPGRDSGRGSVTFDSTTTSIMEGRSDPPGRDSRRDSTTFEPTTTSIMEGRPDHSRRDVGRDSTSFDPASSII